MDSYADYTIGFFSTELPGHVVGSAAIQMTAAQADAQVLIAAREGT